MSTYICPELLDQIESFGKKIEDLKVKIQLFNQDLKNKPKMGLNPKGPFGRILSDLEDCEFFFDQLEKLHGLKYLPKQENSSK